MRVGPTISRAMAVLALILACVLWGVSFPLVKALHIEQSARLPEASSMFLAAWLQVARFFVAGLLLLPFLAKLGRPSRLEFRQGLWLALWGGLGMGIQADGLAHTDASTSAFLTQAYTVILPLWVAIRDRARPSFKVVGATSMVLLGGAILSGVRPGSLGIGRGEIETLLSTLFFSVQILTLENPKYATNRGLPVTLVMCLGIAVLHAPAAILMAPTPSAIISAGASWSTAGNVLGLAVFCSIGAYLLMNTFQRKIPATEAGLIYTSEPVFTAIYSLFLPAWLGIWAGVNYPNETLTIPLLVGGGLLVAANVWMQIQQKPHRPSIAPAP